MKQDSHNRKGSCYAIGTGMTHTFYQQGRAQTANKKAEKMRAANHAYLGIGKPQFNCRKGIKRAKGGSSHLHQHDGE